jgi:hypothetical protein
METSQRNSLCNYLYLKLAKKLCFSFYLLCFFFYKVREEEKGTESVRGNVGTVRRGDGMVKEVGG